MDSPDVPSNPTSNAQLSPFLFSAIMDLLRPTVTTKLRHTCRQAAQGFANYVEAHDEYFPLDCKCLLLPNSVDASLRWVPFLPPVTSTKKARNSSLIRSALARAARRQWSWCRGSEKYLPSCHVQLLVNILESIAKNGSPFFEGTFHFSSIPLVPCASLVAAEANHPSAAFRIPSTNEYISATDVKAQLSAVSQQQHIHSDTPRMDAIPLTCERADTDQPPLLLSLSSPPCVESVSCMSETPPLLYKLTMGTKNVDVLCSVSSPQSQPRGSSAVPFNTLPTWLAEMHMGGFPVELAAPCSSEPRKYNSLWAPREGKSIGIAPIAAAASLLNQAAREAQGYATQRFSLPSTAAVCELCGNTPVPLLWAIAPKFLNWFIAPSRSILPNQATTYTAVVDLSEIRNVVSIADSFLMGSSVTRVLLPRLVKVETLATFGGLARTGIAVGGTQSILWNRDKIEAIIEERVRRPENNPHHAPPLRLAGAKTIVIDKPLQIAHDFLRQCRLLQELDLDPIDGVQSVGAGFLQECASLKSIRLNPLSHVTQIPSNFMCGCASLGEADLSPLVSLNKISRGLFSGCVSLGEIKFPKLKTSVNGEDVALMIDGHFLAQCSSLTTLDLRPLGAGVRFTELQTSFVGCVALSRVIYASKETEAVVEGHRNKAERAPLFCSIS